MENNFEERNQYDLKRSRACIIVRNALQEGQLIKPETCLLCGSTGKIEGHHWQGYDHPLSVWFICSTCNAILRGRKYHCGQVSIDEARVIVQERLKVKEKRAERAKLRPKDYQVRFLLDTGARVTKIVTGFPDQWSAVKAAREVVKKETGAQYALHMWTERIKTQP